MDCGVADKAPAAFAFLNRYFIQGVAAGAVKQ
jgi:hypothetical protein